MKSLLLLLGLALYVNGQNCGPFQCYPPSCGDGRVKVDILFIVDTSGSMSGEITSVKREMINFINSLQNQKVDPAFAIIKIANDPGELVVSNNGNNGYNGMLKVRDSSMPYWERDIVQEFNSISTNGGYENSLEAVWVGTGRAASNSFYGLRTPPWRSEAKRRVVIVLTDEDSDPPTVSANKNFLGYSSNAENEYNQCYNDVSSSHRAAIQKEVDEVAKALIRTNDATYSFYAFLKQWSSGDGGSSCLAQRQYGLPQSAVQNADFTGFDPTATKNNLANAGFTGCLQYQLLNAGRNARLFDVDTLANNPTVARNFFEAIVADTAVCDSCFEYKCQLNDNSKCAAPVDICDCAGTPYGTLQRDCNGVCGGSATLDCAGRCVGGNTGRSAFVRDQCGVCIASMAPNALCGTDCDGDYYLLSRSFSNDQKPSLSNDLKCPTGAQLAGLMAVNQDLWQAFRSSSSTIKNIICGSDGNGGWWRSNGQFESRIGCEYNGDFSFINRAGTSLGNYPTSSACAPNSLRQYPGSNRNDQCGNCRRELISNTDFCQADCTGTYRSSQAAMWKLDNCNTCVEPSANLDANKDSCGVCFGGDRTLNQCGECQATTPGWTNAIDACGNPACDGDPCDENCDGENEETLTKKREPNCNICRPLDGMGNPTSDPKCVQDCANEYYYNEAYTPRPNIQGEPTWSGNPRNHLDECNICVPFGTTHPSCIQLCDGKYYDVRQNVDLPFVDDCGQCVLPGVPQSCQQDCNGVFYGESEDPAHLVDDCGLCKAIANMNEDKDECGVCTNLPGYVDECEFCDSPQADGTVNSAWTLPDERVVDGCGDCFLVADATPENLNWRQPRCGECLAGGPANPAWNDGVYQDDLGVTCPCFSMPEPCAMVSTISRCSPDDCPPPCPDGSPKDACERCPTDAGYGTPLDTCGQCCEGTFGACDRDLDDCGVCFGGNSDKDLNPCGLCDSSQCIIDCEGVPNGPKRRDCNGICREPGVCFSAEVGFILNCDFADQEPTDELRDQDLAQNFPDENGDCNNPCGNGVWDTPDELCDPTAANDGWNSDNCNPNCTLVGSGLSGGAVAGIVVAVLAAVILLAAAIAAAAMYAFKAGLLGSAFTKVDLGAASNNPLYKGTDQVHANPLYNQA